MRYRHGYGHRGAALVPARDRRGHGHRGGRHLPRQPTRGLEGAGPAGGRARHSPAPQDRAAAPADPRRHRVQAARRQRAPRARRRGGRGQRAGRPRDGHGRRGLPALARCVAGAEPDQPLPRRASPGPVPASAVRRRAGVVTGRRGPDRPGVHVPAPAQPCRALAATLRPAPAAGGPSRPRVCRPRRGRPLRRGRRGLRDAAPVVGAAHADRRAVRRSRHRAAGRLRVRRPAGRARLRRRRARRGDRARHGLRAGE